MASIGSLTDEILHSTAPSDQQSKIYTDTSGNCLCDGLNVGCPRYYQSVFDYISKTIWCLLNWITCQHNEFLSDLVPMEVACIVMAA